ncbi:bifunctional glutamate N-acetyltransferase/amino-acid acetyltransferase ArgJ [Aeoliella sp. ICT_H6.2]|uniref:Arginine biosynthesis bifunctional protein ArgJ n=1 Tax=Aeoliella straminimaris TaxID=2954799 RepID=A0A9X2JGC1_9BACT|nr:bifunctional glutamate N-acetyltransferase/amino-acid acetyltransferase ArgJ [Aeoliella straminimaris]MCO6043363.1 bifunctional glutamate N-acetyltransferase/amino-acid acetyltransferase ArgJ [Aeoliella straminimaris]
MTPHFPIGFSGNAVHAGIKQTAGKEDVALILSDRPTVGVGVYTQNLVCAAPVTYDRSLTPSEKIRAVVINSGVANACTGDRGDEDCQKMATMVAQACGLDEGQTLVLSTGVIGVHLPMEKIESGIKQVSQSLSSDDDALERTARGMMTTDTVTKKRGRQFELDGVKLTVTGIAKGAAMIGPNMATMLSVVMTDANLSPRDAHQALQDAVSETFNCISVDGHTSTNDTVLLLANGAAGGPVLEGRNLDAFRATLYEVCEDLAQSIPADGEGATHLVTVEVHGCRTRAEAVKIGKTIADSPLVKTAIHGADPNWGRVVSAAGYAGVPFNPHHVSLHINGLLVYERGAPVDFDEAAVSKSMAEERETSLLLILDEGAAAARFWTTDLTAEYVRLNADYTT